MQSIFQLRCKVTFISANANDIRKESKEMLDFFIILFIMNITKTFY
jgi:hypothetical protein